MKKTTSISSTEAPELAEALKGLAHPLRLRIVAELCNREMNVSELCEALEAKQSMVSQHLAPLRMLGLLNVNRSGGKATYSLAKHELPKMINCIKNCGR